MKNFWLQIAENILRFKYQILGILVGLTCILGYQASQIQLSYELAKILPTSDERFQLYENFKSKYGEDGNVMVIGLENDQLFTPKEFKAWNTLTQEIKQQPGIKNVLSITNLPEVYIDSVANIFSTRPLWEPKLSITQINLDHLHDQLSRLPLFTNFIFTKDFNVHLMMITLDQKTINNKNRIQLVQHIKSLGDQYSTKMGHSVHYSGMPFIRTEYTSQVTNELAIFLILAILVTSIILFYFSDLSGLFSLH